MTEFEIKVPRMCGRNKITVIAFNIHPWPVPGDPTARVKKGPLDPPVEKVMTKVGNEYHAEFDYQDDDSGIAKVQFPGESERSLPYFQECYP